MAREPHPEPEWIVATAGTGGNSATLARYVSYTDKNTGVCVADPENSAFLPGWQAQDTTVTTGVGSRIEGIGRQRVEPSFIGSAIDRMIRVPDAAAIATVRHLDTMTGRKAGATTGTGLWAAFRIVSQMIATGRAGSVVALLCDPGERYIDKYYSDTWLTDQNIDISTHLTRLQSFMQTGQLA